MTLSGSFITQLHCWDENALITVGFNGRGRVIGSAFHVQPLQHHQRPGGHHRVDPRHAGFYGQPAADARRLPGLQGARGRQQGRGPRAVPDALGDAVLAESSTRCSDEGADKLRAKGQNPDFKELLRMEPDSGVTNIRNTTSKHWKRWLGVENRCVVPFTSFSEFNKPEGGDIWFALDDSRPLAVFAGIWTNWTCVRKVKEGETTNDLFGFLTTEPNDVVAPFHPKAMPVILTTASEIQTWLTAPADEALSLQRPMPSGALRIVARGSKKDGNT